MSSISSNHKTLQIKLKVRIAFKFFVFNIQACSVQTQKSFFSQHWSFPLFLVPFLWTKTETEELGQYPAGLHLDRTLGQYYMVTISCMKRGHASPGSFQWNVCSEGICHYS